MKVLKRFKLIGTLAHQPQCRKKTDFSRIIEARDIVDAMRIYRKKLRGVKKNHLLEIKEI